MAGGILEYMNKRKLVYAFSLWLAVSLLFHCTGLALPDILMAFRSNTQHASNHHPFETTKSLLDPDALSVTSGRPPLADISIMTTDLALRLNSSEINNRSNRDTMSILTPAKQGNLLTGETIPTQSQSNTHESSTLADQTNKMALNPIINTCRSRLLNEFVYHQVVLKLHASIIGIAFIANLFLYIGIVKNIFKLFRGIIHPEKSTSDNTSQKYGVEMEQGNKPSNATPLEEFSVLPDTHSSYHGRNHDRRVHRTISNSAQLQVDMFLAKPLSHAGEPHKSTQLHRMENRSGLPLRQCPNENEDKLKSQNLKIIEVPKTKTIVNRQTHRLKNSISIVLAMTIVYCIFNAPQVILSCLLMVSPVPIVDPGSMRWAVLFKVIQALFNVVVFLSKDKEARAILKGICKCR